MFTTQEIDRMSADIHAQNVARGWWDEPDPCLFQKLQLINCELAEATEADRKDLMDSHLTNRKGAEVELADAVIRMLDLGGRLAWKFDTLATAHQDLSDADNLAARHFTATQCVCFIGANINDKRSYFMEYLYSRALCTMFKIAEGEGYDLKGAIDEKLRYNQTRADFDLKNRSQAHGKRY